MTVQIYANKWEHHKQQNLGKNFQVTCRVNYQYLVNRARISSKESVRSSYSLYGKKRIDKAIVFLYYYGRPFLRAHRAFLQLRLRMYTTYRANCSELNTANYTGPWPICRRCDYKDPYGQLYTLNFNGGK